MRLDVVTAPDVAYGRLADSLSRRHQTTTPVRVPPRLGLQRSIDHCFDASRIVGGFPALAGSDFPESSQPLCAEPLSPQANGLTIHAILSGNHNLRLAGGDRQNYPATPRHLLCSSQGRQPPRDFPTLLLTHNETH